ncbi:RING-H2 finger protein ATL14 [Acorus calamus]|uniref:RING-H2 finger protein ATL14 n=1 Tax=Acorus calamus TaxID=4465 RepID=A0AAV9FE43_ACOCL|nr:RING-H2 finger protein ATL14 [Acorus calamus]
MVKSMEIQIRREKSWWSIFLVMVFWVVLFWDLLRKPEEEAGMLCVIYVIFIIGVQCEIISVAFLHYIADQIVDYISDLLVYVKALVFEGPIGSPGTIHCFAVRRGGGDCAVCMEDFNWWKLCRVLPGCNHCFHRDCVDRWLVKSPSCPLCRSYISIDHGFVD